VSGTGEVLLGVIAVATLAMAVLQVGLVVVVARLGRRMDELARDVRQDLRPLIERATVVAENAARASSLAVVQVERADQLFSDLARRVDDTMAVVQGALLTPAREGRALLAAVTAAIGAFRELRMAGRARSAAMDEEESLFIG
jgi:hypothetical protein